MRWRDTSKAWHLDPWPHPWPLAQTGFDQYLSTQQKQPAVLINPQVRANVYEHLRSADGEQGGLLVGRLWNLPTGTQPNAPMPDPSLPHKHAAIICVEHFVPSLASDSTAFSLKMSAQVWSKAGELTHADPSLCVVGWYHSHPNLGAFFSSTDRDTQAAFFSHGYSVGWVIDPSDEDEALFIGARSVPIRYFLIAP
jgi:Prokaryotic homologs of the JAB domain